MSLAAVATAVSVDGQQLRDVYRRTWKAAGGGVVAKRVRTRTGQLLREAVVTLGNREGAGARSTVVDGRFDVPVKRCRVFALKAGVGGAAPANARLVSITPAPVELEPLGGSRCTLHMAS